MERINNKDFYKKSFEDYGITARGVHWSCTQTQYKRFEIITNLIKDEIRNSSIIDIGCGFAEYINYLNKRNLQAKSYLGIDSEEFMIEISSKRFKHNNFLKCDITVDEIPEADFLICSGALNIFNENDFFKAIEKCFNSSKKAFIFNFLTDKNVHKLSNKEIEKFCKNLSPNTTICNDYLPNDSTFFIKK